MQYLLLFYSNNGCASAPYYYITRTPLPLMNQVHTFTTETCLTLCTKCYNDPNCPVFAVGSPATDYRHIKVKHIRASGCNDNCSAQSACDLINTARCAVKHHARKLRSNYRGRYQHYMDQQQRKPLDTASDITSDVTEYVMWPVVIC